MQYTVTVAKWKKSASTTCPSNQTVLLWNLTMLRVPVKETATKKKTFVILHLKLIFLRQFLIPTTAFSCRHWWRILKEWKVKLWNCYLLSQLKALRWVSCICIIPPHNTKTPGNQANDILTTTPQPPQLFFQHTWVQSNSAVIQTHLKSCFEDCEGVFGDSQEPMTENPQQTPEKEHI